MLENLGSWGKEVSEVGGVAETGDDFGDEWEAAAVGQEGEEGFDELLLLKILRLDDFLVQEVLDDSENHVN